MSSKLVELTVSTHHNVLCRPASHKKRFTHKQKKLYRGFDTISHCWCFVVLKWSEISCIMNGVSTSFLSACFIRCLGARILDITFQYSCFKKMFRRRMPLLHPCLHQSDYQTKTPLHLFVRITLSCYRNTRHHNHHS